MVRTFFHPGSAIALRIPFGAVLPQSDWSNSGVVMLTVTRGERKQGKRTVEFVLHNPTCASCPRRRSDDQQYQQHHDESEHKKKGKLVNQENTDISLRNNRRLAVLILNSNMIEAVIATPPEIADFGQAGFLLKSFHN